MARFLKRGMDAAPSRPPTPRCAKTVEGILTQVDARKDAAIRELSEKFDKWSPKDFKLVASRDRARHRAGAANAISTTSNSRRRRCATSRRSSARP